jgi:serine/threonine protein kinase
MESHPDLFADMENWKIDGYEFQDLIHRGSVVFIYRAYQYSLKRHVAIHTLNPLQRNDPENHNSIQKAADIIAKLEHPNIFPVIDFGYCHNDVPYIVTQWMSGGFLRDYLLEKDRNKEKLSPQWIAGIVMQIDNALDYLHSQDQVHGDPSPASIVLDAWGKAYLSDFIKRAFDETTEKGMLGLPHYAAPELWLGSKKTSSFTDQYALGIISHQMVTGKTPFADATSFGDLMQMHISRPVPSPQNFRSNLPETVATVLTKALSRDPYKRYPTIMTFAREFEKAILNTPTHSFISYSRNDMKYAQRLKEDLSNNGFQVWIDDDQIEHGDMWFNEIISIQGCASMVVIMTPEAEASECVGKEILLAKRYGKTIFPILLKGMELPILIDTQFEDVRERQNMPGSNFYRRLSREVYGGN